MPDTTNGKRTIDSIGRRAFLGALGTGAALSVGVGSAAAQDVTLIDSCTTITEPGQYRLTQDLESSFVSDTGPEGEDAVDESEVCIEILANDVHFDGDGHTLTNPAERELGQLGVTTSFDATQSNVTIENVTSVGWEAGFAYVNTSGGALRNVTAQGNEIGIAAFQSDDATIADAAVEGGIGGISLQEVDNSTVAGLTADENSLFGLAFFIARNNTVCNATISETGADPEPDPVGDAEAPPGEEGEPEFEPTGISVGDARNNRIVDSTVTSSSDWDVFVSDGASDNPITNLDLDSATVSLDGQDFAVRAVDDPPEDPEDLANVGGYVTAADRGENPLLDLDVHYQDDEATTAGVDEEALRLWAFVEEWTEVADSSVDTEADIVSALLEEFDPDGRVFGPFGET